MTGFLIVGGVAGALWLMWVMVRGIFGITAAFVSSGFGVIVIVGAILVTVAGLGWNAARGLFGFEPMPIGMAEERITPFLTFSQIGLRTVEETEYLNGKTVISAKLTNGSVYPVTLVRVRCSYDLPVTNMGDTDSFIALSDEVLQPGESIRITGGSYAGVNPRIDPATNFKCTATGSGSIWSVWKGIPYEYQHLDWQNGYFARSRSK